MHSGRFYLIIDCLGCKHRGELPLEGIGFDYSLLVGRLVCSKCSGREVSLHSAWRPEHVGDWR